MLPHAAAPWPAAPAAAPMIPTPLPQLPTPQDISDVIAQVLAKRRVRAHAARVPSMESRACVSLRVALPWCA